MSVKQCWAIIAGLILLNISTVLYFLYGDTSKNNLDDTVASVGDVNIKRADLADKLDLSHGRETLREMVNDEVIRQMADKNGLSVTKEEVEMERRLHQSTYGYGKEEGRDEKKLMEQLKLSILFEKILTKDVQVAAEEIERYLDENNSLFNKPDLYHVSHIIVEKKSDAENIIKDLKAGADFSALAMEYSPSDPEYDLGMLSLETDTIPTSYKVSLKNLKAGQWSEPHEVDEGYAVLYVEEFMEGKTYTAEQLEPYVKRRIAMEQLDAVAAVDLFWDEVGVKWVYEQ